MFSACGPFWPCVTSNVDLLALLQLTEALGGDVRVVGEDVGAAAVLLDEAEALFRVEPLHGASSHVISPSGQSPEIRTVRTPRRRDDCPVRKCTGNTKVRLTVRTPAGAHMKFLGTTTATGTTVARCGPIGTASFPAGVSRHRSPVLGFPNPELFRSCRNSYSGRGRAPASRCVTPRPTTHSSTAVTRCSGPDHGRVPPVGRGRCTPAHRRTHYHGQAVAAYLRLTTGSRTRRPAGGSIPPVAPPGGMIGQALCLGPESFGPARGQRSRAGPKAAPNGLLLEAVVHQLLRVRGAVGRRGGGENRADDRLAPPGGGEDQTVLGLGAGARLDTDVPE